MPESVKGSERLFTIIMDFEGTTSVSQFRAASPLRAAEMWLDTLTKPGAYGLTELQRSGLLDGGDVRLTHEDLTPLDGLRSAWSFSVLSARKGMAHLNVVETAGRGDPV
jgi:hypothetical protein